MIDKKLMSQIIEELCKKEGLSETFMSSGELQIDDVEYVVFKKDLFEKSQEILVKSIEKYIEKKPEPEDAK